MSEWKTSICESTNEFRGRIGLQFFAEGEGGMDGADMDGDFSSDFEAGLLGDTLENQQGVEQDGGEGAANGLGNQQPGGQQGEPENQPPDKANSSAGAREGALGQGGTQQEGQSPVAQQQAQPAPVPMTYNGQQILLPAEAVQELRGALGMDPIELLQKGMNYDRKAERELRLIDQFAQDSGLSRQQYVEKLEAAQRQQELAAEVEKCRAEFPDTPDAALRAIAEGRMAAKRAAAQQQAVQREQQLAAVRQRAASAVEQARQKAADQQQAAIQAGVDSAVANLNAQKDSVGKLTKANNAAAEKAYMQTINPNGSLAENLAANGLLSTGLTESSQIQAGNAYQTAVNENALTETEAIAEIERAITQAQLSGDLQAAQALSDLLTQIAEKGYAHVQDINALNQWQSQFGYNMGLDNAGLTGMYNGNPTMAAQQLEMQKRQLEEDLANGKIDRQTAQKQLELLEQQIEAARLQNKYYQTQL